LRTWWYWGQKKKDTQISTNAQDDKHDAKNNSFSIKNEIFVLPVMHEEEMVEEEHDDIET
jgi:hypothetical protein